MSGLLPHVVSDALHHRSLFAASTSFGLVTLVLVLALLAESDVVGRLRAAPRRHGVAVAITLPLLVTVLATLVARVARFAH